MADAALRAMVGVLTLGSGAAGAALWADRPQFAGEPPPKFVCPGSVVPEIPEHIRMKDDRVNSLQLIGSPGYGHTLNGGMGGGSGAYGSGAGGIGAKKDVDIGISNDNAVVMGSLDKELIRQVIHRNRQQIQYCYETQLTRFPKLAGKVAISFVIGPEGTVQMSKVASSNMGNSELEQCIASRFKSWIFPKPKGGGIVQVTYPLILNKSGQ
jgi:hypothetical protein